MGNNLFVPLFLDTSTSARGGSAEPGILFHILSAFSVSGQTTHENLGGSRAEMIKEVPAKEAKKAEGASLPHS